MLLPLSDTYVPAMVTGTSVALGEQADRVSANKRIEISFMGPSGNGYLPKFFHEGAGAVST
ncbi:hypothetical protein, partial [Streptomyces europaeiscabiei]|uniref:hypothetical protein n=1 Tax=Streptomyces europaeiscabiei TaxID=146819 RepID=UPI0038F6D51E